MLRIYYGPDTYSQAQAVEELKLQLDADGMLSANTVQFDGAHPDFPALIATCDTVPFLASHRLVIVCGLLAQVQTRPGRARGGRRGVQEGQALTGFDGLVAYVPSIPQSTTLLLLDGPGRIDNSLLDALQPMAEVRRFPLMGEQQLLSWVANRARALGATFEPKAASLLVRSVRSGDLWTLAAEVDKLSLFAAGRTIAESDVRQLIPDARESNVFGMVDAIVAGRLAAALLQLRLLQQEGAAGPYLITMIARQFRQLIVAEDMSAAGAPAASIAKAADIRSDAVLPRVTQQARRMGATRLQRSYECILDADLSIKRGQVDEDVALDLLVTDLARGVVTPRGAGIGMAAVRP
ncbi:MAG TPA: DNA polymerase III subunit delta [Dehalococcoidia bacterium]|nr:DNA polymerase III subunit delta [Dehalococcoidia bacterium]